MHKRSVLYLLLLALLCLKPAAAQAQEPRWLEHQTKYIALLYPEGSEKEAETYAAFVDTIYDEVTAQLGYKPAPPLSLRIYPSMDLYRKVNPLAQAIDGILAHAHTGRREISIALPQTRGQTEEEIRNNVRHELTHIIAAELSGNKLSVMWQEGIAQYVERPAPQLEAKIRFLNQAIENNNLATWSRLDAPGVMYGNPILGYPQSWSMATFLIQREGMPTFLKFLQSTTTAEGYRAALQQAYGTSATILEEEWRAWLPEWAKGGWRTSTAARAELSAVQAALDAGRYSEAEASAEQTLAATSDPETRAQVETLLDLARKGVKAEQAARSTRTALLEGDYQRAEETLGLAEILYAELNRTDVDPLLSEYASRIDQGAQGHAFLASAQSDVRRLRFGTARSNLQQAALIFGRLGDQAGQQQTTTILAELNSRIQIVALSLLTIVVLGLAWNLDRRRAARRRALPFG